jgi:hypothetical protein
MQYFKAFITVFLSVVHPLNSNYNSPNEKGIAIYKDVDENKSYQESTNINKILFMLL